MEIHGAFPVSAGGDIEDPDRNPASGPCRDDHGDPCRHDHRRILENRDGLARRRAHPRFERSYTELVYQPMLELLSYLRANGFKTFIVSGGGVEFMRPWTEKVYGIPPNR